MKQKEIMALRRDVFWIILVLKEKDKINAILSHRVLQVVLQQVVLQVVLQPAL